MTVIAGLNSLENGTFLCVIYSIREEVHIVFFLWMWAIIVLLVFVILFIIFGIPFLSIIESLIILLIFDKNFIQVLSQFVIAFILLKVVFLFSWWPRSAFLFSQIF